MSALPPGTQHEQHPRHHPRQARDPEFPGLATALPLGIQHVLAMFVSNITPAIIVAGAAGFGFGSRDPSQLIYMIQMSMLFAGIATLMQSGQRAGLGAIGARLPLAGHQLCLYLGDGAHCGGQGRGRDGGADDGRAGLRHRPCRAQLVGRIRFALPPLVTGLVVLMIGLSLMRIAVDYAAGGPTAIGTPAFGAWQSWLLAGTVVVATFVLKFFGRGWSTASVLIGLAVGYALAAAMGRVSLAAVGQAGGSCCPRPHFGLSLSTSALIGFVLTGFVSSIETIGDVEAICEGTAGRPATDRELIGAVGADGVGTALAAVFGAMPNTTFSQNVGLIAITGVMSRHIVSLGAGLLVISGLIPKVGAAITTIPIEVLGGGVIVMFGMVASSALSMLARVEWSQRNMLIFGVALAISLGLQLEPAAIAYLPETPRILLTSGVLPAALIAVLLNLVLPKQVAGGGV
jgi:NCS2 family nucleobase:cation symporter-2